MGSKLAIFFAIFCGSLAANSKSPTCEERITQLTGNGVSRAALIKALAYSGGKQKVNSTLLLAELGTPFEMQSEKGDIKKSPGTLHQIDLTTGVVKKHPLYHSFLPEENKDQRLTSEYGAVALDQRFFKSIYGFRGREIKGFPNSQSLRGRGLLQCSQQRRKDQEVIRLAGVNQAGFDKKAKDSSVRNPCVDQKTAESIFNETSKQSEKHPLVMLTYSKSSIATIDSDQATVKTACQTLAKIKVKSLLPPVGESLPSSATECDTMDADCSQVDRDKNKSGTD